MDHRIFAPVVPALKADNFKPKAIKLNSFEAAMVAHEVNFEALREERTDWDAFDALCEKNF